MAMTHAVTNQPPPLAGYDAADDQALLEALHREGAGWAEPDIRASAARQAPSRPRNTAASPTRARPGCAPTTVTATASMRWSSTPRGTS